MGSLSAAEASGGVATTKDRKEFPCERCGSSLTFHIGAQRLACEHCGFEKALEFAEGTAPVVSERDLQAGLALQARQRASSSTKPSSNEVSCRACGAICVFDGSLTSSRCAYCDTPLQLKDAHVAENAIPVDAVAPFQLEHAAAQEAMRRWIASRWFAPNEWRRRGIDGKFDGVYMPFFTFDAMTFSRYRGERGDAYYVEVGSGQNRRRERRVRWSSASGAFSRFFDDVCIPALKSLPQALLRGLEPWPTEKLIPFSDGALAGKRAHTYELPLDACFGHAKERIEAELHSDVRRRIGGDEQRVHSVDTQYSALTYKHVLLPVWILAYRFGDKAYRVVVNAVTGQVHGERPWSIPKILAAVALGLVVAYLLVSLGEPGHPRAR